MSKDALIADLAAMKNGWAGEGALPPAAGVIGDIKLFWDKGGPDWTATAIAEVDDSTGRVTFLEYDPDGKGLTSVDFTGDGTASVTYTHRDPDKSRRSVLRLKANKPA